MRTKLSAWLSVLAALFIFTTATTASGSENSKFSAWSAGSAGYEDSPIPLLQGPLVNDNQNPTFDARQDRQYPGYWVAWCLAPFCNDYGSRLTSFAAAYPGHHYIIGDEPNAYLYTPEAFAASYKGSIDRLRQLDGTARVSPGGIAEDCRPGHEMDHVNYATAFYTEYLRLYQVEGRTPPPLEEFRFNLSECLDWASRPNHEWQIRMNNAAAWSAARGRPMAVSFGFHFTSPAVDIRPELQLILNHVQSDSRISSFVWWHYTDAPHPLWNATTKSLTPDGRLYASYAIGQPSIAGNGLSAIGDFNADGRADFADRYRPTGHFWMHLNIGGGFDTANYGEWTAAAGADWDVLVADFNGDNLADYADVHVPSGQVWIHRQLPDRTFDLSPWVHAPSFQNEFEGDLSAGDVAWLQPEFETFAGDINGDHWADVLRRDRKTGLIWAQVNNHVGGFFLANNGQALGRTRNGPDWRTIVADFTGDTLVDYADQHIPSGTFWIHRNLGTTIQPSSDPPSPTPAAFREFHMNRNDFGSGTAAAGSDWRTVIGDFTGDGFADYADLSWQTGIFYIHANLQNGAFAPPGVNWGIGYASGGVDWEILGSR